MDAERLKKMEDLGHRLFELDGEMCELCRVFDWNDDAVRKASSFLSAAEEEWEALCGMYECGEVKEVEGGQKED